MGDETSTVDTPDTQRTPCGWNDTEIYAKGGTLYRGAAKKGAEISLVPPMVEYRGNDLATCAPAPSLGSDGTARGVVLQPWMDPGCPLARVTAASQAIH